LQLWLTPTIREELSVCIVVEMCSESKAHEAWRHVSSSRADRYMASKSATVRVS